MRRVAQNTAIATARLADPYIADQLGIELGRGIGLYTLPNELYNLYIGVLRAYGKEVASPVAIVSKRLLRMISLSEARDNAHRILRRCGCTEEMVHRYIDHIFLPLSVVDIAAMYGTTVPSVRTPISLALRISGSINRGNMMVRLAGISDDEWCRDMSLEGVHQWVQKLT